MAWVKNIFEKIWKHEKMSLYLGIKSIKHKIHMKGIFGNIGAQAPFTMINDTLRENIRIMRSQTSWWNEEYDQALHEAVDKSYNCDGQWDDGMWWVDESMIWSSGMAIESDDRFAPHVITMRIEPPDEKNRVPVLKTYIIPIMTDRYSTQCITPAIFKSSLGHMSVISTRIRLDLCEKWMDMYLQRCREDIPYSHAGSIPWESTMPVVMVRYSDIRVAEFLYLNLADEFIYICPMRYISKKKYLYNGDHDSPIYREQKNFAHHQKW